MTNVIMTSRGMHKEYHNSDWGSPELDDGHVGHIGLTKAYKICTDSSPTIATITAGKKGYITFINMYNTHTSAQTFTLADTDGTVFMTSIGTLETITWIMGRDPLFELAAGIVTGDAGTTTGVNVTISYYEK